MSRRFRFHPLVAVLVFLPLGVLLAQPRSQPGRTNQQANPNLRSVREAPKFEPADPGQPSKVDISGPYTHDNLAIFLLHGPDRMKLKKYLMLADALEKKLFVIHETQSVNTLEMENLSADTEVIILSGDLFKGGQQDRFAQFDMIVPPKSGKVALPAYCVEHTASRWMARLDATNSDFAASPGQVVTNAQRLAGRFYLDQSAVWKEVRKAQDLLTVNAGTDVRATKSDSSLALSLKVKEVVEAGDRYLAKLQPILKDRKDVIGYAYAINGKVVAADVFGSNELFRQVWGRLLRANATEAFAELGKGKSFASPTREAVEAFLKAADEAKAQGRMLDAGKQLREVQSNDEKARILRFETQDQKRGAFLRRNYLKY